MEDLREHETAEPRRRGRSERRPGVRRSARRADSRRRHTQRPRQRHTAGTRTPSAAIQPRPRQQEGDGHRACVGCPRVEFFLLWLGPTTCGWRLGRAWGSKQIVTELTPAGDPVATITFPGTIFTYRGIPVESGVLSAATLRNGMNAMPAST